MHSSARLPGFLCDRVCRRHVICMSGCLASSVHVSSIAVTHSLRVSDCYVGLCAAALMLA